MLFNWNLNHRRAAAVRKPDRPTRRPTAARFVPKLPPVAAPTAEQIRDFLAGRTRGETLLHALYDPVLDEPVPPRLRRMLRR